jgi:hypothetical protein
MTAGAARGTPRGGSAELVRAPGAGDRGVRREHRDRRRERIADLLRPGGWIIAQEPLRSPPPRCHPDLDAITTYWELMHEVMERAGAQHLAVEGLPASARAAGLEIVSQDGFFVTEEP